MLLCYVSALYEALLTAVCGVYMGHMLHTMTKLSFKMYFLLTIFSSNLGLFIAVAIFYTIMLLYLSALF